MRRSIKPRTCVACRRERLPREMLRVVRTPDGQVILDERGKQSGRGAYVCPEAQCVILCFKKRLLEKALKTEIPTEVRSRIIELAHVEGEDILPNKGNIRDEVFGILGLARRANELIIGQDRVTESIIAGKLLLVLLTNDHSESLSRLVETKNVEVIVLTEISRTELGQYLGLRQAQIAALPVRSGFAGKIKGLLMDKITSNAAPTKAPLQEIDIENTKGGKAIE